METKWICQKQEQPGTYMFSGKFYVSAKVSSLLSDFEIAFIFSDVQKLVLKEDGIDYLVVYVHEVTGQKLFFIDQLDRGMVASGEYKAEYNHATLILAEEY